MLYLLDKQAIMAKSNNDTRKTGKKNDARKENQSVNSKQPSNADGKADKIAQLRNAKTHFQSPYGF